MASLYGSQATNALNTVPAVKVDVGLWGSKQRIMYDSFTIAAAPTSGDKLYMGRLPKGARVVGGRVTCGDLGSAGTLNIGYEYVNSADGSAVTNAYYASLDVNSAAVDSEMAGTVSGYFQELAGDAYVVITITTAWTVTSGSIQLKLAYVVD